MAFPDFFFCFGVSAAEEPAAAGAAVWCRSGSFRYHHNRQPGGWNEHAAGRHHALCIVKHCEDFTDEDGASDASDLGDHVCDPAAYHLCAGYFHAAAKPD